MPWPKGKKQSHEMIEKRKAAYAKPEVKAKMVHAAKSRTVTDETRRKTSETLRGRKRPPEVVKKIQAKLTGRPLSVKHRQKIAEAMRERWQDPNYRARVSAAHTAPPTRAGSKASLETIEKLRQSHRGKTRTVESCLKQAESIALDNHYNWQGGIAEATYRGIGWNTVKRLVRQRAAGRCELCGGTNIRNWQLDVHHIVPYAEIPISVEWGCLAVCRYCHAKLDAEEIDLSELQGKLRPRLHALLKSQSRKPYR